MIPSPAELTYFIEVANSLNLSRAAERLDISQPSLSLAIKRLETAVGTELLIRHKFGVTLTQAGKQFLLHARQLLQYWENTKAQTLASYQTAQGCFTFGCPSTIAIHMLAPLLPAFLATHPKVEIQLRHDISRKIVEQIINLSLDIGIGVNPVQHPDLVINKLCDDEATFWVGPGKKSIQDIHSDQAVLICDPDLTQTQALLKKCKKRGIHFARQITANSLEVIAAMTANGVGIGILPARVATSMYSSKLKRIPNTPVYSDELCLIYRHETRNIEAIRLLIAAIKAQYK